jgi:hypothetical protein
MLKQHRRTAQLTSTERRENWHLSHSTTAVHRRPYENRQSGLLLAVAACNYSLHKHNFPRTWISRSFLLLLQKGISSLAAHLHGAQERTADTIKSVKLYTIKVLNVEINTLFTTSHHLLVLLSGMISTSWNFCFFPYRFLWVDTLYEYIFVFTPCFSHLSNAFHLRGRKLRSITSHLILIGHMVWIFLFEPRISLICAWKPTNAPIIHSIY